MALRWSYIVGALIVAALGIGMMVHPAMMQWRLGGILLLIVAVVLAIKGCTCPEEATLKEFMAVSPEPRRRSATKKAAKRSTKKTAKRKKSRKASQKKKSSKKRAKKRKSSKKKSTKRRKR